MKKVLLPIAALALLLAGCGGAKTEDKTMAKLEYPKTKKVDTIDNYFGTKVADPYRWLENDTAADTKSWVEEENKVTNGYLSQIPYREKIKTRLQEIWNFERYSAPFHKGKKYFYTKNDGLQNQAVLYMQDDPAAEAKVLMDPNKLSTDGTVALAGYTFSKDGKYMAYSISRSGSDWEEIYVLDVNTGKRTTDSIRWAKFTSMAWKGDGFYYSRFDAPKGGSGLSASNEFQKIYFHKLGDAQASDKLIFMDKKHPKWGFGAETTDDERFLLISGTEGASSGNELFVKDLQKKDAMDANIVKINSGFENNVGVVDEIDGKLLILTDKNAPRFQLIMMDPAKPDVKNWKTIIPEDAKHVLQEVHIVGGKMIAVYMQDASKHAYVYDMSGKRESEIALPGPGSVSGFGGEKEDKTVFYNYTSFTYPSTVFKYDIATGKSEVYKKPNVKFNPEDYETKQVFFKSKDGKEIPMFIVHKKGLKMDGNNPTLLYSYGGFNISLNPNFSVSRLILLENGGVYAMANLRGGGEYGEEWHKAGMLANKQNVFNDFIGAAEYLISNKYTSSSKLAIQGGSNGGLLVGACMTQRPDLYRVCIPQVGVMDMLRFHKFTIGYAWASEYGSSDNKDQFPYIYKYSPVQNIKAGVSYPATLVTTADHDDRVVPAHSFKFIATLQEKNKDKSDNPVLIRIDSKAGHGAGKPTAKQIEEAADIWSFIFYNEGVTPKY